MEEAIKRSKAKEQETFQSARERHLSLVFAFVSRRIKPREEAEDVTAEVFVAAYRCWRMRRGETRLWLLGIARRKVADAYRRQKRTFDLRRDEEPSADALREFEQSYESRRALAVLFSLPDAERDALALQALEGLSIEEIAEVLGRSHSATNSLLQRARTRVRETVERQR